MLPREQRESWYQSWIWYSTIVFVCIIALEKSFFNISIICMLSIRSKKVSTIYIHTNKNKYLSNLNIENDTCGKFDVSKLIILLLHFF